MMSAQTVLEWQYEPKSFFEEKCTIEYAGGHIAIQDGNARGEFEATFYEQGRAFRDAAHQLLTDVFLVQQIQVHTPYALTPPSMTREHSDGRRDATGFPETLVVKVSLGDKIDIIHKDASGNILKDTRAERLNRHLSFRDDALKLKPDKVLQKMMRSYKAALSDRNNLFLYLYEIRDALKEELGAEGLVCEAVGVSISDWRKFGQLSNDKPLLEGRHRGKHTGLGPATKYEITWALEFNQRLIEGYVAFKSKR